jgi:hypothetical protein
MRTSEGGTGISMLTQRKRPTHSGDSTDIVDVPGIVVA